MLFQNLLNMIFLMDKQLRKMIQTFYLNSMPPLFERKRLIGKAFINLTT